MLNIVITTLLSLSGLVLAGSASTSFRIKYYNTSDCSSSVITSEVIPITNQHCFYDPVDLPFINGLPVPVQYQGLRCPEKLYNYGTTNCSNAVPLNTVCLQGPSAEGFGSFSLECVPNNCKPDPGMTRSQCNTLIESCAPLQPMKW
jgi:hypothetical protein